MSKTVDVIANAIKLAMEGESMDVVHGTLSELDNVEVKVWRENNSIQLPIYAKEGDACMDVYAKEIKYDDEKDRIIVHTGLHFALPESYEMELRPRSNLTKTEWYIPNAPCTLDWGYRGELLIIFKCRTSKSIINQLNIIKDAISDLSHNDDLLDFCDLDEVTDKLNGEISKLNKELEFSYKVGDRICQLLIRRKENVIWNLVSTKEELGTTERGDGGFGSTNKQK